MQVLVVGGTGNVGKLVLSQLLSQNHKVRAIVRSPTSLPDNISSNANLTVIQGSLLDMSQDELVNHIRGCDAVVSTLGHNMSYKGIPLLGNSRYPLQKTSQLTYRHQTGILSPPHYLVRDACQALCTAIQTLAPTTPTKFILLNTVGVSHPSGTDSTHIRTPFESSFLSLITTLIPPQSDNTAAAEYIVKTIGLNNPYIQWCAVRPDGFIDGDVSEYVVFEDPQHPFYASHKVRKANIAKFVGELVGDEGVWGKWRFKMPVIENKVQ